MTLEELRTASEVFTAGTSVELQPVVALVEDAATTEWPVGPVTRQMILDFRASVTEASKISQTLRERETGLLERRPWPARVAHSQTT